MIKSARFQERPHRLEAQDATLSRLRPEFESPWGHLDEGREVNHG